MNHPYRLAVVAALALLCAGPGQAALVQVTMTGLTDNTFVGSGDPCGTGLSGGNACNNKSIVISILIDTGSAPADQLSATDQGYFGAGSAPGFLQASATIGGLAFAYPAVVQFNFGQTVETFDNLDGGGFGILDRVQFGISGGNPSESFSVSPNVIMTSGAFSGDTLEGLAQVGAAPLAVSGSLALSNGSFNFTNATGQVQGQYRLSQASFAPAVVPAPPAVWLLGTAVAGLALRRARRSTGKHSG